MAAEGDNATALAVVKPLKEFCPVFKARLLAEEIPQVLIDKLQREGVVKMSSLPRYFSDEEIVSPPCS